MRLSSQMFTTPTTIIVGAGASVEFGLPSGKEVFANLVNECRSYLSNPEKYLEIGADFQRILNRSDQKKLVPLFSKMAAQIEYQPVVSIDEYLNFNPKYYELGKLFSLVNIASSMYETLQPYSNQKSYKRKTTYKKSFYQKEDLKTPTWLASLARLIVSNCSDIEDLRKNKLTILTYNYDTNIEDGLLAMLSNTERFSTIKDINFIEVLHVNGQFELRDYYENIGIGGDHNIIRNPNIYHSDILQSLSSFFMINEEVDSKLAAIRSKAVEAIENSRKIYSIGFACDPTNCKLIGLDELNEYFMQKPEFYALNYNGDIQLSNRLSDLGAQKNLIDGTAQNPLGCSAAAAKGFFEQ